MLDLESCKQRQHDYYASQPTDNPHTLNGFTGAFAYEDPVSVPELFRNFAVEHFNLERYRRVDLDKLNTLLNELWDGPGSCAKISDLTWDIRIARRAGNTKDALAGYDTPTVDSQLETQDPATTAAGEDRE